MAGVGDPDSVWAGRVKPGLVAAFVAGRARLAPAGLTVEVVQVRWRERPGVPWIDPVCFRWLVRSLGARGRLPPTVRVTVRVTEGRDGSPQVGVVTRPGLPADFRRRRSGVRSAGEKNTVRIDRIDRFSLSNCQRPDPEGPGQ